MTRRRRSLLQNQLLLSLRERPAKSITELADRLGAKRPSVSRSLNRLTEAEFVAHQDGSTWTLTDAGRSEATLTEDRLTDEMVRSIKAASRRYVTIRDKDGNFRRFVPSDHADPGKLDDASAKEIKVNTLDALHAISGVGIVPMSIAELAGAYTDSSFGLANALRNLGLANDRMLNPLATIAAEQNDRLQDAIGGIGALAVVDHFDRVKGAVLATMPESMHDLVGRIMDVPIRSAPLGKSPSRTCRFSGSRPTWGWRIGSPTYSASGPGSTLASRLG